MGTTPGIVVVTKFCRPGSRHFRSYIKYMDRPAAARNANYYKFNIKDSYDSYIGDYMDNPQKTTGLFSKGKFELNDEEKTELRKLFETAQDNGSLMWQTVISFDNRWLAEYGIYDPETCQLDELRLKTFANQAIGRMLENEGLENAVWTAAIHYNTDNIHIHVATVEPFPQREMREYKVFTDEKNKIPLLDANGKPVTRMEPVGMFRLKSLDSCKNCFVNEITNQREVNIQINDIIRGSILGRRASNPILNDPELTDAFLNLYVSMPRKEGRSMRWSWNYNNMIMAPLHPLIDAVSDAYLNKYCPGEMDELHHLLSEQEKTYQKAYGSQDVDVAENKIRDLYYRLGNSILKEIKTLDINLGGIVADATVEDVLKSIEDLKNREAPEVPFSSDLPDDPFFPDSQSQDVDDPSFFDKKDEENEWRSDKKNNGLSGGSRKTKHNFEYDAKKSWSTAYGEAMSRLYSDEPDYDGSRKLLEVEELKGNPLAAYALGDIYRKGVGVDIDLDAASYYYGEAFDGFSQGDDKNGYSSYRLGKMYLYGYGVEQDFKRAEEKLLEAGSNGSLDAWLPLGNMYYFGTGVEKNITEAWLYYDEATDKKTYIVDGEERTRTARGRAFAFYRMAEIEEKSHPEEERWHREAEPELAYEHYKEALRLFERDANSATSDSLLFRLGTMYEHGKGCDVDMDKAQRYYERAANVGNLPASSKLALIYLKKNDPELTKKAISLLERVVEKGDEVSFAQYSLGKVYSGDSSSEFYDISKAVEYLTAAKDGGNELASYQLGRIYSDHAHSVYDLDVAVSHFMDAAEHDNEYADYACGKIYLDKEYSGYSVEKSISFFNKSADKGNQYAMFSLGSVYSDDPESEFYDIDKAIHFYNAARENGSPFASYRLGRIYNNPDLEVYDLDKAVSCFTEAAEHNNGHADYMLGKIYMNQDYDGYSVEKSIASFEKAAEKGNQYAQYSLGVLYSDDPASDVYDIDKAIRFFNDARENGNFFASYRLGKIYSNPDSGVYDLSKAVSYFTEASDNGNEYADYSLGRIYLNKEFEGYSVAKSIVFLEKAADRGNQYAQYSLGTLYSEDPTSEFFDINKAVRFYNNARENGNVFASYQLGKLYVNPDNGIYDLEQAALYFIESSEAGNDYADYYLGKIHLNKEYSGFSVEKGLQYLEKAADTGNQYAQLTLGCVYMKGEHVPDDRQKAREYFEQSAVQGNEIAGQILNNMDGSVVPRTKGMGREVVEEADKALSSSIHALRRLLRSENLEWLNMQKFHELEREIERQISTESSIEI